MTKSIVARQRERIAEMREAKRNGYFQHDFSLGLIVDIDTLAALLDIVEEMAAVEPYEPAIGERHELECLFCGELGDRLPNTQTTVSHALDCPYIRAREMCGKGDD